MTRGPSLKVYETAPSSLHNYKRSEYPIWSIAGGGTLPVQQIRNFSTNRLDSMSIKVHPTKDMSQILAQLSAMYSNENGRISWPGGELEDVTFGIIASVKFSMAVSDETKEGAIWKAINDCARAKNFSQKFFFATLKKTLEALESHESRYYSVVTQLNVPSHRPFPKRASSAFGPVEFYRAIRPWEREISEQWRPEWREHAHLRDGLLFMRTAVRAKSGQSAIDLGYRNIQAFVGLMNLITGGYGLSRRIGIPDVPLGTLLCASGLHPVWMTPT